MQTLADRPTRLRRWPLVAALLLIAASVVIGVFGPRLGDGRAADALQPIGDLAVASRDVQERMQLEALERPEAAPGPTSADLAALATESLGVDWTAPDLATLGGVPILAGPVPLAPDGRGVAILYEFEDRGPSRFVTLVALPDAGRYAIFDEFGRARVLDPAQAILESDRHEDADGPSTLVWSDGTMLFIARSDERMTLVAVREAFGAR